MAKLSEFISGFSNDECAVIFSEVSRHYLSSFRSSDGILLITSDFAALYLDSRYEEAGRISRENGQIPKEIEIKGYSQFKADFGNMNNIKKAYFEDRRITVSELLSLKKRFPDVEWIGLGDRIEKLRVTKTPYEIEKISASQKLAEAAFSDILGFLSENVSENDVAARIEWFMRKNGASSPSFQTICVSGKRGSLPHGVPTDAKLEKNSFVTMDFGCVLDGFSSDMTRTVCIGKASDKMKFVYNTVLSAQKEAMKTVKAGVLGKEVDFAARNIIEKAGFGKFFGHSTGHGIGLEVHEAPSFSPMYSLAIPENAVLSVEPGIYLPGEFGVRIENLVAVEKDGYLDLNSSSGELIEI